MSEPELKIDARHPVRAPGYSPAIAASEASRAIETTLEINRPSNSPELIPFNGLLTNTILAGLPGSEFEELLRYLEPVSLHPSHELYGYQQSIDFAYFPETAVISHLYLLEDGSTAGASIVGREGIVGLSAILGAPPPAYWTKVVVGGSALRIRLEVIKQEFDRGRVLQQLLLGHVTARLTQLSQKAVCNGRHRVLKRLCTWLLMIQDRVNEDHLQLTQEQIAHHLGARRPGITASCNSLRDQGLISYHRGLIHILDRPALESSACECYRILKRH